jgi:hypothetical protein
MREISGHGLLSSLCGCGQKELPRKMEKKQLVCSSRQCYSTLAGFGKVFLSKEQCGNTVRSPILTSLDSRTFLPVPSNEIGIAGKAVL